jgi:hypothetical protein
MEKVFNFGIVALIVSVLVRFLVSQSSDQGFAEFMAFQPWEKWLYGISFGWFLLAAWNLLIRRRCPRCRSTDLDCVTAAHSAVTCWGPPCRRTRTTRAASV